MQIAGTSLTATATELNYVDGVTSPIQSQIDNIVSVPAGVVSPYAGTSAPSGYLLCYGQEVSRSTYSALFSAISTTYGSGDGSSTFNLPDLRGRAVAGQDDMGGSVLIVLQPKRRCKRRQSWRSRWWRDTYVATAQMPITHINGGLTTVVQGGSSAVGLTEELLRMTRQRDGVLTTGNTNFDNFSIAIKFWQRTNNVQPTIIRLHHQDVRDTSCKLQFKPESTVKLPRMRMRWLVRRRQIRFYLGFPERLAVEKYSAASYLGTGRSLIGWSALDGSEFIGLGTTFKYYIEEGSTFNDITPIRSTTSAGDVTFSATNDSSDVTVTDAAHGAVAGDFVTFSGAASLGGQIVASVLNKEHQIKTITDSNTYVVDVTTVANSSDTGNGGSSVVGTYQVNVGLNVGVGGSGWGAGLWGGSTNGALANTLSSGINNSVTTIPITDASSFPTSGTILIDNELITYTRKL